jgi:hypothetical protein
VSSTPKSPKRARVLAGAIVAATVTVPLAHAPLVRAVPAFSGADGAGAAITGGRGGVVYHVTKLDTKFGDNGPGTLQYGLNDSNFSGGQARTIVFDVGGTIFLGLNDATNHPGSNVEGWDTQSRISVGKNITIAGQTAPGGIFIAGGTLKVNGNNTIIRNVTIGAGYGIRTLNSTTGYADAYVYDDMNIHATGVMIDHVSALFGTDEGISADEFANNVTMQYCNISQGQNYPQADAENPGTYTGHALGSLWQPGSNAQTSILHNLYAHEKGRLPRVGTEASKLTTPGVGSINDFRNNVFYNWLGTGGSGASAQPSTNNFVSNFWLAGPGGDDASGTSIVTASGGTGIFSGSSGPTGVFNSGNLEDSNKDGDANDGAAIPNSAFGSSTFVSTAYNVPYNGVTDSATSAYSRVLNYVGANWQSRDAIDARIVNQVRTGTGKITAFDDPTHGYNSSGVYVTSGSDTEWNSLLALRNSANGGIGGTGAYARAAGFDSDGDGMPNVWEAAHGLNPAVADNNGDYDNNGFTNLEEYLNESAAFPAPGPIAFSNGNGTQRYAEIGNWTTGVFEPSRFDEAQVNSGTVKIDAIGQHAGTLKIATSSGNTAALSVTAGWIDVNQSLLVGPGGSGSVTQSGGIVHAGTSVVIGGTNNAGSYTLSGGTLATPLLTKSTQGGTFNFTGGTLHADQVAFSVTNNGGTIAPGSDLALQQIALAGFPDANGVLPSVSSAIGNTHINGSLTLNSGTVQIELASPTSFDTLTVDGVLTLGGALDPELLNGYEPSGLTQWTIATASSINGQFSSIPDGWTVLISGGNLVLEPTPVPEPAGGALLTIGSIRLLTARRKRRSNAVIEHVPGNQRNT